MIRLLLFTALTLPFFVHASEYGKIYHSFDSENDARVIVVPAVLDDHYYIHYKNFNYEYDDQALLYKKIKNDLGDGFYYQLADTSRVNVRNDLDRTMIHGTLYSYSTVLLGNDSKTKIIYTGEADVVQARNVKKSYHKRQLDVDSKIAAKKQIKLAKAVFAKSCKHEVKVTIDWDAFIAKEVKASPAKLSSYLGALSKICAIDSDYLDAVSSITKINVIPSEILNKQKVSLEDGQLTIQIASEQPNLPETSYQAIFNIL